ncbi:uncharacterized protein LOC141901307 isoform X2 [Tubulanus polymorphus]|uniref:uncharacterized protein LOC141901307 isoform X2 n=1 Tax=Tubulanus polymorphus TaxID=672921 RepID=UPI003DA607FD
MKTNAMKENRRPANWYCKYCKRKFSANYNKKRHLEFYCAPYKSRAGSSPFIFKRFYRCMTRGEGAEDREEVKAHIETKHYKIFKDNGSKYLGLIKLLEESESKPVLKSAVSKINTDPAPAAVKSTTKDEENFADMPILTLDDMDIEFAKLFDDLDDVIPEPADSVPITKPSVNEDHVSRTVLISKRKPVEPVAINNQIPIPSDSASSVSTDMPTANDAWKLIPLDNSTTAPSDPRVPIRVIHRHELWGGTISIEGRPGDRFDCKFCTIQEEMKDRMIEKLCA